jgi:hypothetical protein
MSIAAVDSRWKNSAWVLALFATAVLGLLLRLDGIGSSLWLDEFGTLWAAEGSLATMWQRAFTFHGQTPLYYTLVWGSLRLFGESEISVRSCSLLFGLATWVAITLGVTSVFGKAAGRFAFVLAAFDSTLISTSANARPYGLAIFFLTVFIIGFLKAGTRGGRVDRALWILGGAGTAWAHYLLYPVVLGMLGAYFLLPALRERYPPSTFRKDLFVHAILVSLSLPQLVHLFLRMGSLDWIVDVQHLAGLKLIMPYWIALALGATVARPRSPTTNAVQHALWISIVLCLLALEGLNLLGVNLLHWRYLQGVLIPVLFLAAGALGRMSRPALLTSLLWAGVIFGLSLRMADRGSGSFTRLGEEDWRQAVSVLDEELGNEDKVPVLFRSGFVEEDKLPFGSPVSATRAPLRSPGRQVPEWDIIPLTWRWETPERQEYFNSVIQSRLDDAEEFYLLAQSGSYASALVDWVDVTWPGVFRHCIRDFGLVRIVHFRRDQSTWTGGAERCPLPPSR